MALARWLWVVAGLVVTIVAIGGITRLTESGLSITHWSVVSGILPPLSESAWQAEFDLYRQTGEYRLESGPAGMDLAAFKFIYFWEWFHRILGRVIGLAFLLPMMWFWIRGMIPAGYRGRLLALFALICGQGALGWYMVASGVGTDLTDVSHFRLSAHLLTALFLLAGLVWTALDLRRLARVPDARPARFTGVAWMASIILFIQILLGAWVAGLNAGHASYSWPMMNGGLLPQPDLTRGWLWALTHDPFLLHFLHRWWAWVAVIALVVLARKVRPFDRRASIAVHSAFGTMVVLGIATVLSEVSLWIAVAHQLTGALLVISTAWAAHAIGTARKTEAA
ncbi:cytochrome c oxidase assembly protein [Erythrobacter litoralis HTCC2594]|uniref:Heme A synthase n=2 Tax=Erythrobacter litoralis TaxID=39960 RepID=CTAA_ERYLH|nr:RecName: Full=Heme A synthase; Short=HAS; AltName: Full=Cytochrome aa3-controlling protein [Erythrobacter litoralis HTCC2594]ABC64662.1 cytochrome c oxidase assembly protein [Erythrobacter litoralis HTCC2594]